MNKVILTSKVSNKIRSKRRKNMSKVILTGRVPNKVRPTKNNIEIERIKNNKDNNLKKKLQELIPNSKEIKFSIGYLDFSGIKVLYETLKKLYDEGKLSQGHIKILVGKYYTKKKFIQQLINSIQKEFDKLGNDEDIHDKFEFFIKLLKEEIIIIKKNLEQDHSKTYLFKTKDILAPNIFIIGSSNLTEPGLTTQKETNIKSNDNNVFKEEEKDFDESWKNAIPLSKDDIRRLERCGIESFRSN
jgi:HKD family nuclease